MDLRGDVRGACGGERGEELDDGRPGGARRLGDTGAGPRRREVAGGGAQALEQGRRRLGSDARHQPEHAQAGHGVLGVLGEAQEAHEILDVRHLDEAQAAVLVEGDVAAGEFHLERHGVVLGAEEHGLLLELGALLAVGEDALAEPLRLLVLVAAGGEDRAPAVGPVRPELLVAPLGGLGDERVGGGQDRRRGAVVLRERDDVGAGEALLEVEDVAHRGGAEAVDGLGVVADAGDAGAVGPQQADDVGLQRVGVLVLVDQHVVEALAHARAARRVGEQAAPEEQQVVVVQDLLLLFGVGVARRRAAPALLRPAGTTGTPCAAPRSAAAGR